MDSLPHHWLPALAGTWLHDAWIKAFLPSLRLAVVMAMTPVLYAMPIPGRVRALLVIGLSWTLAQLLPVNHAVAYQEMGGLFQAACVEVALGIVLALGVLLAFAAFSLAGNLLDVQIGFGIAQVFDPVGNKSSPLLVSAFNYVAVVGFMLVDGHHSLLRALAYSFELFPAGAGWPLLLASGPVFKHASGMFVLGFALAAPVVFCILLVEFALGLVARNLPQINMLVLGIPAKIVVGFAVMSLWFAGMGGAMNRVYMGIFDMWGAVFLTAAGKEGGVPHEAEAR
jgi:flagellar biosynthetic protein FliR